MNTGSCFVDIPRHGSPPKKLIQIPGLSTAFFHFFRDCLHQSSRTFPGLLTKFQESYGVARIATVEFIFCKIKTYIL